MSDRDKILKNFSRFATCYDGYSDIQSLTGNRLLSFLNGQAFGKIIDIGCGTGNYTKLLRKRFPAAVIKAVDICNNMIDIAKQKLQEQNIDFIIADAEEITFTEKFDLITSNACFQWFRNLSKSITRYGSHLDKDGILLFSIFGPLTFKELRASLSEFYGYRFELSANAFISISKLLDILNVPFDVIMIKEELFEKSYASLWQLLQTIKYTGTRGAGLNGKVLSKTQIGRIEEIYNRRFDGINATYQIFYCKLRKKAQ